MTVVGAMSTSSIVTALAALVLAQPALPDTVHLDRSAPVIVAGGPSSDTEVGRDAVASDKSTSASDPSTWRWYVSKVLDNQRRLPSEPAAAIGASRFKVQP